MKKYLIIMLSLVVALTAFMLSACGGGADTAEPEDATETEVVDPSQEGAEEGAFDGAALGYEGDDWSEFAVYQYLAEEIGSGYNQPEGAICLPVVQIIDKETDDEDGSIDVKGDFWVFNYVVEGDTLKCVSGGAHPGKMELIETAAGYAANEFEGVADGGAYEQSARDIFEEKYDEFVKVSGDAAKREELRAKGIATYVKAKGLAVTKYQDEGWDPVDIPL